jgi:uncharacterized protein (DUF4415 family)
MSKASERKRIQMPTLAEDRRTTAAAQADPDAQPLSRAQLNQMTPLRGRPPVENKKQLVSIRYSPEVIEFFRATGEGWQARMNQVLREHVLQVSRRTSRSTA